MTTRSCAVLRLFLEVPAGELVLLTSEHVPAEGRMTVSWRDETSGWRLDYESIVDLGFADMSEVEVLEIPKRFAELLEDETRLLPEERVHTSDGLEYRYVLSTEETSESGPVPRQALEADLAAAVARSVPPALRRNGRLLRSLFCTEEGTSGLSVNCPTAHLLVALLARHDKPAQETQEAAAEWKVTAVTTARSLLLSPEQRRFVARFASVKSVAPLAGSCVGDEAAAGMARNAAERK